jgi:hypothetical protein
MGIEDAVHDELYDLFKDIIDYAIDLSVRFQNDITPTTQTLPQPIIDYLFNKFQYKLTDEEKNKDLYNIIPNRAVLIRNEIIDYIDNDGEIDRNMDLYNAIPKWSWEMKQI